MNRKQRNALKMRRRELDRRLPKILKDGCITSQHICADIIAPSKLVLRPQAIAMTGSRLTLTQPDFYQVEIELTPDLAERLFDHVIKSGLLRAENGYHINI